MVYRKLTRTDGWKARLAAELDAQRLRPFQWGDNDCVLGMARRVVMALTEQDPTPEGFSPRYRSERGALKALKEMGFKDLREALSSFFDEIHPDQADAGDLALIEDGGIIGQAVGVFEGGTILVLTQDGHGRIDRGRAFTAFKV